MGRLALLTPSCGGQRADREEKRVAHGNEINRQQGRRQEQLDFKDPNQRSLLDMYGNSIFRVDNNEIEFRINDLWDFEYKFNYAVARYAARKIAVAIDFRSDEASINGNLWLGSQFCKFGPNESSINFVI